MNQASGDLVLHLRFGGADGRPVAASSGAQGALETLGVLFSYETRRWRFRRTKARGGRNADREHGVSVSRQWDRIIGGREAAGEGRKSARHSKGLRKPPEPHGRMMRVKGVSIKLRYGETLAS